MLQWEQLNYCDSHCVRVSVKVRQRFGNDTLSETWTFEFAIELVVLAWKLPDLPCVILCVFCHQSRGWAPLLAAPSCTSTSPSSWLPTPPTPALLISHPLNQSGSVLTENLELGQREGSCLVWDGAARTLFVYPPSLSLPPKIAPLPLPREGDLCVFNVSVCCGAVWHDSYEVLACATVGHLCRDNRQSLGSYWSLSNVFLQSMSSC